MLTACILYCETDKDYVKDCLDSLPKWCQIVLMKTQKSEEEKTTLLDEGGNLRHFLYEYTEFDFSRAKNKARSYAQTKWILVLDADERLNIFQHAWLKELLETIGDEYGGIAGTQWSHQTAIPSPSNPQWASRMAVPTVRIFRNLPPFKFCFPIHEVIDPSIYEAGYKVLDTKLDILHEGWNCSKEEMLSKLKRNGELIWRHPELIESERYQDYMKNNYAMIKILEG